MTDIKNRVVAPNVHNNFKFLPENDGTSINENISSEKINDKKRI